MPDIKKSNQKKGGPSITRLHRTVRCSPFSGRRDRAKRRRLRSGERAHPCARTCALYEKGIHDHDAGLILSAWLPVVESAGTLVHSPEARALAVIARSQLQASSEAALWPQRARQARQMRELFASDAGQKALAAEISERLSAFAASEQLLDLQPQNAAAAAYLLDELAVEDPQFVFSKYARELATQLRRELAAGHRWDALQATLEQLGSRLGARAALLTQWLRALVSNPWLGIRVLRSALTWRRQRQCCWSVKPCHRVSARWTCACG